MEALEELREKVLPVLLPWGVKRIALFGSTVRGQDGPGSDIDILVDLKEPEDRPAIGLKWFALEEELSRLLGREVELVSGDALSPYIRPYVEEDMVVLFEEG
ncbi:MAG: nucleotidyltransferase [Anaerolineae bacterium]|nr:nucleotidyltransferase [Anaerolineae bacterium]NIN94158.1 nucleotidyltransferase [Anaerolineae bacterium]NIQ77200.1 nucleotidyltransferase [Anaerolineae bacterium]